MAKPNLKAAENFINRELSWLEFNDRVLQEGLNETVPLLERLKFLAIVSSNLDEFFMVRVAGLMQQRAAGVAHRDPSGMTPDQQLVAISERVHRMVAEQTAGIHAILGMLADEELHLHGPEAWTTEQQRFVRSYFNDEIHPVLTPLAVEELEPVPLIPGLRLNVALLLRYQGCEQTKIVVVPIPGRLSRFVTIPAERGVRLARLEDIIVAHAARLYSGAEVVATTLFRLTRDGDSPVTDDDASDLLHTMEEAVLSRRRRAPVRLEVSSQPDRSIMRWLLDWLKLEAPDIYEIDGMLDPAALMQIVNRRDFTDLKDPRWPPQPPRDLIGSEDPFAAMQQGDALLIHPYESFDPVVGLLEAAATDPSVMAIKQVLYRTSGDSPIIRALERAAQKGKQVTVLVELKARFDEARNIRWARRLEDAGCDVIYGIAGLKTHAKALLVVRREGPRVRRYVHLATGNYNDRTARLYSDIGLLTCDRDLAGDVAAFFNLLTGYSEAIEWSQLTIAPTDLRQHLLSLIEREIQTSTRDDPGEIVAKVNSLQDRRIITALFAASRAGVRVRLNVRGICCLRPGLKKISKNIEVRSVVDRFLEHARVVHFRNGGHEEVYLSSADWMTRNLDKRLELLFPVRDDALKRRLIDFLTEFFLDNEKAHVLLPDGSWQRFTNDDESRRAQERLFESALLAAEAAAAQSPMQFKPLKAPPTG